MKKIKNLDLEVYSKKLDNGLEIYVIPDTNSHGIYATYNVKYGGLHNEFMYENEMISVPIGIAHFLEHKMFETENGEDVMTFFNKSGTDANANTSLRKTTYLFRGKNNYYNNLEYLLEYVETPYFTDSNVEKEKGIIIEELEMHKDNPYSRINEVCLYNSFINHPVKYPIIGTVESIKKITKEDLYKCYNTFYNPNNMFIVITGNVDVDKTFEIIEKHENKRKTIKKEIVLKEYNEPNYVEKKYDEIDMDVTYPILSIAYKINIENSPFKIGNTINHIYNSIDLKLGTTSILREELMNNKIINNDMGISITYADSHILVIVTAETNNIKEVEKRIREELKTLSINKEDYERRLKYRLSNIYGILDSIYPENNMITDQIIRYNKIDYDPISSLKQDSFEEINNYLSNIDLSNTTVCLVENKNA